MTDLENTEKPLVTCIIIFLNGEPFISEAIKSVFTQSYANWELLLVDDGSTDNSTRIALDYAQQYPEKVRYIEHKDHQNLGMSATRNLGIAHAQGAYVAFLDADDVWLTDKLADQVNILETYPDVAMVYGRSLNWHSWTGLPEDQQRDYFVNLGVQPNTIILPPNLLPMLWTHKTQKPMPCNAIIRYSVFTSIGQFENNFRNIYEDRVFYTKVELHAPVYVADQFWSKYRQHKKSSIATYKKQNKKIDFDRIFFSWAESYLMECGKEGTDIWKTLIKTGRLSQQPILRFFYSGESLDSLLVLGKKLLPIRARQYLWRVIGTKLYRHHIEYKKS